MTTIRGKIRASWTQVLVACDGVVPEFPEVTHAVLPAPPLLTAKMTPSQRVKKVLRAYATVMALAYDRRVHVPEGVSLIEHEHYAKLVDAAELLLELKISPIAWVAFSSDVWREYMAKPRARKWDEAPSKMRSRVPKNMPPSIQWIFSTKRLSERVGWFSWAENRFRGGRVVRSKHHREITRRYERMKRALIDSYAQGTLTPATARGIVAAHLPKAVYAKLKENAETAAEIQQDKWDRAAATGEWLWS